MVQSDITRENDQNKRIFFVFQFMFLLFLIYGSVIIMNLIVAIMINQMDEDEAEAVLMKQRIDEISTHSEIDTLLKKKKMQDKKDYKVSVSLSGAQDSNNVSMFSRLRSFLRIPEHNVYRYTNDVTDAEPINRVIATITKHLLRNTVKMLQEKRRYLSLMEVKIIELQARGKKEVDEILNEHQKILTSRCTCPCSCGFRSPQNY